MPKTETFRNINIKVPSDLLAKIKIMAIHQNCFTKDLIIDILKKGVKNAIGSESRASQQFKD
ncbi:MAG: hypothetical protein FJW56_06900 [Actinobacteria bacterium]|nr:hypothetical protein [Actinomycetota bacterium]